MEKLKFINIHIGINYEGYSVKNVSSEMSNMWYGLQAFFAIQLFIYFGDVIIYHPIKKIMYNVYYRYKYILWNFVYDIPRQHLFQSFFI